MNDVSTLFVLFDVGVPFAVKPGVTLILASCVFALSELKIFEFANLIIPPLRTGPNKYPLMGL